MNSLRSVSLALLAGLLIPSSGCRTAGVNNLAQKDVLPAREKETARELLADHNRNAELVQSLEARPSVSGKNRSRLIPGGSGRLALERPRDFRLTISAGFQDVADIGSNDDEFWFWFKDSPEKAVYYANYDESGASPLAAGLQPDWIIEAMGLRVFPDSETATMKVRPGNEAGTLILSRREKTTRGVEYIKEITLSQATHRIREQRIYSADHKNLLARSAITGGYKSYPLPVKSDEGDESVFLPEKLRLEMSQDKVALDVSMSDVKLNKLESSRRKDLFAEPGFKGFARVNLAEQAGIASSTPATAAPALGPPTSIRETLPAPAPRVRLKDPVPLGIDGALRIDRDPSELTANLPGTYPRVSESIVGPRIPTVTDTSPIVIDAQVARRNSLSNAVER